MSWAVLVLGALVAQAPPLCKGKQTGGYDPSLDRAPSPRATAEVQAAYNALCPKKNCGTGQIRKNATVGFNAITWVSGIRDGQKTRAKIVYAPNFLNTLSSKYGAGASFGVLAHEVGHHLTAAKGWRGRFDKSWDEELRADYLAGCALARAGYPPDDLENALKALAAVATPTHPPSTARNPAMRKGYKECEANTPRKTEDGFGIGAQMRRVSRSVGCWMYWYRTAEDVNRKGPVAAKRRASRSYASRAQCESVRKKRTQARVITSDPCRCGS